jgi:hypothetical protein
VLIISSQREQATKQEAGFPGSLFFHPGIVGVLRKRKYPCGVDAGLDEAREGA